MATLSVTPATQAPGQVVDVDGSGFDRTAKFYLTTVDSAGTEVGITSNTNRPRRDGSFYVGINAPPKLGPAKVRAYQRGVVVAERALTVATAPVPIPEPTPTVLPPTRPFVYVATPTLARPTSWTPDPYTGCQVRLVADGRQHHYARTGWVNADSTLGMLTGGYIFDFRTLAHVATRPVPSEPQWSNTTPKRVYGMLGNGAEWRVVEDVLTGSPRVVRQFTGYSLVTLGWNEGTISDDDGWVALAAEGSGKSHVLLYDIAGDRIAATIDGAGIRPNNCTVSRRGTYVLVDWDRTGTGSHDGLWQYDRTGKPVRQLSPWGGRHMDPALDKDGREVMAGWLSPDSSDIYLESVDLETGRHARLIADLRSAWYSPGSHVSGRGPKGYCVVSAMGRTTGKAGADIVAAVALDGSGEVRPYAHQHGTTQDYNALAKGAVSRDGSTVIWNAGWDGAVSAFVARVA
jgi:hypothetical protein